MHIGRPRRKNLRKIREGNRSERLSQQKLLRSIEGRPVLTDGRRAAKARPATKSAESGPLRVKQTSEKLRSENETELDNESHTRTR